MFNSIDKIERPTLLPSLTLAIIGDTVYDLYFKNRLITKQTMPCGKIHTEAIRFVKASAQAEAIGQLESSLSEEEDAVYKRGRNAKSQSVPRHANLGDYHMATGFEALIGYLYLSGRYERIDEILNKTYEILDKPES